MKIRLLPLVLSLAALVSVKAFALPADLVPAMVALDKKYIPALGFSGQPDQLAQAKVALVDNSNGPAAHEALEGVRMTFLASRTRQKVPYFIDQLTLFHNSMEDLLNNLPAKKALESGDDKAFSEKLAQLKPNFIKTFFLFGDFSK